MRLMAVLMVVLLSGSIYALQEVSVNMESTGLNLTIYNDLSIYADEIDILSNMIYFKNYHYSDSTDNMTIIITERDRVIYNNASLRQMPYFADSRARYKEIQSGITANATSMTLWTDTCNFDKIQYESRLLTTSDFSCVSGIITIPELHIAEGINRFYIGVDSVGGGGGGGGGGWIDNDTIIIEINDTINQTEPINESVPIIDTDKVIETIKEIFKGNFTSYQNSMDDLNRYERMSVLALPIGGFVLVLILLFVLIDVARNRRGNEK